MWRHHIKNCPVFMATSFTLRQVANQVSKSINAYRGQVRVMRDCIVVDNYWLVDAAALCKQVSGMQFEFVTQSIARLKK